MSRPRSSLLIGVALWLALGGPGWGTPERAAEVAARHFFEAFHTQHYRQAYDYLSASVQRDVAYEAFESRSRDILSAKVLDMTVLEKGAHLVRFHVKGKLRLRYRGSLFDAIYGGTAAMTLSQGQWRVDEVDLKPLSQKRLNSPDYHL